MDDLTLTKDQIEYGIQFIDLALRPCDPREAMVMLDDTLELYGVPDNWDKVAKFYLEAIEDMPADLLKAALKNIRFTLKWFPKPVELRQHVNEALWERRHIKMKLEVMRSRLQPARAKARVAHVSHRSES